MEVCEMVDEFTNWMLTHGPLSLEKREREGISLHDQMKNKYDQMPLVPAVRRIILSDEKILQDYLKRTDIVDTDAYYTTILLAHCNIRSKLYIKKQRNKGR